MIAENSRYMKRVYYYYEIIRTIYITHTIIIILIIITGLKRFTVINMVSLTSKQVTVQVKGSATHNTINYWIKSTV